MDPYTRLTSRLSTTSGALALNGNIRGVTSASDSYNSTLFVNGDAAFNGVLHASTLKSSNPVLVVSDQRLKYAFTDLPNVRSTLQAIKGTAFKYRSNHARSIGFKAQEVEACFPELVVERHGVKFLAYAPLVAFLWEAVKDAHQRIDSLEARTTQKRRPECCDIRAILFAKGTQLFKQAYV
jgi:hypothetical protein